MTVKAIYENGVFRPTEPVNLPDNLEVEVLVPASAETQTEAMARIYQILSRSYETGRTDLAERHNEHQP